MNLTLPEVLVTSGPTYATQINNALDVIDAHDHSSSKGLKITPLGLNINQDLSLSLNQLVDVKAVKLTAQASVATLGSLYVKGVDLFYRTLSNNEIQITAGTSINTSSTGAITGLGGTTASASYVNATKTFIYQQSVSSYAKQEIGDITIFSTAGTVGSVSGVTLKADVLTGSYDLNLPAVAPTANQFMRMEVGLPAKFIDVLGTANQVTVTHNSTDMTLSLPQDIDAAATPTFAGLTLTGGLNGVSVNVSGQVDCDTVVALTSVAAPAVLGNTATFTGNIQSLTGDLQGLNLSVTNDITSSAGDLTLTAGDINLSSGQNINALGCLIEANTIIGSFFQGGTYSFVSGSNQFDSSGLTCNSIQNGTSGVAIQGATNGTPPGFSSIGYFASAALPSNMAFTLASTNILIWSLPPGIWEVSAYVKAEWVSDQSVAKVTKVYLDVTTSSALLGSFATESFIDLRGRAPGAKESFAVFPKRLNLSSATPIYLVGKSDVDVGGNNNVVWKASETFIRAIRVG